MRLAYLGSPQMAVPPLQALHDAGHEIELVVTNPPRRRSRRSAETPTPVAERAVELGIAVTHDPDDLLGVDVELGVVVAYGQLIRPHILAHVRMVNLHFSLLPRWRGAAPVERAILAGDRRAGVCLMEVAEGLDTGGVYARSEVEITSATTVVDLREQLVDLGTTILVDSLEKPLGSAVPQADDGVTYAEKLRSDDLRLEWHQGSQELLRVVRVGGAWTTLLGKRLKVLDAALGGPVDSERSTSDPQEPGTLLGDVVVCGTGTLRLLVLQPEGRQVMAAGAFLNGARLDAGTRLGT